MMKNTLIKGIFICLLAFLFGSLYAQTGSKQDFADVGEPLFFCDFQNSELSKKSFVMYDQDGLTPTSFMGSIGFKVGIPWIFTLKDSNTSENVYAAATSSYSPAGQANDWLVTNAINVPTEGFILKWKSQSFSADKRDGLKVFITSTGQKVEDFPATPVFNIDEEEAGSTENADGEWIDHSVKLDAYAGKTIYIAFVNQSNDKSMILLDDVLVEFDGGYTIRSTSDAAVYDNGLEHTVKGEIVVKGDKEINAFKACFRGGDDVIHTVSFDNLNLKKGDSKAFEFPDKLAIELQKTTKYQLWVEVEGEVSLGLNCNVISLAFKPERKIVVEEGTGAWCGACPSGIIALEHLEETYGDMVIPIAVHKDDKYHFADYVAYFNFPFYPSGYVNRKYFGTPMSKKQEFSGVTDGEGTFLDLVELEMKELCMVSVKLAAIYTDAEKKKIKVDAEVKFATGMKDIDYRLAYIIREDYLPEKQHNYFAESTNPIMGEWGKGGKYGKAVAEVLYKDVARAKIGSLDGTKGLIPSSVEVSKAYTHTTSLDLSKYAMEPENVSVVVLLINGKTSEVVNAGLAYLGTPAPPVGINEIAQSEQVSVFVCGSEVKISFAEQVGEVDAALCAVDGTILDMVKASVSDQLTLSSVGYRGVALLKLKLNGQTITKKVIL